ncbi:hypothetical protein EV193_10735 [Herbihabitans rhizosphaerae]|uniref:Uncharacterized protein n=1 Tax=Herbihabitans rhizosphaerae TaxID=1872711 RepID=A0A4Q7KJJ5_9PSEU|nr:hypothetical protein [Herbihabitans rhizosphaerae]RZS36354.1 hypothetical protein EV193_10735 [Herbihabitans rhizosphaerae]
MGSAWHEIDRWLDELRRRRWTMYLYGDRAAPELLCAMLEWRHERRADVVILRGHDRAVAYRAPLYENADPFAPSWVQWCWARANHNMAAVHALRAILTLDPPTATDRIEIHNAPPFCSLSPVELRQRPVVIRPL